ncbi:MAG: hypothetical protein ABL967_16470 [Bryobacteraceae bacterium]
MKKHLLVAMLAAASLLVGLGSWTESARAQIAVKNQGYVPFSDAPIHYRTEKLSDPLTKLKSRLERGEIKLEYDPAHGYLQSILKELKIPASSQTLVFSKTSFQYKKISPQSPRALYFNDDVYVGQVHDGKVLEFISFDANLGAVFYILDEQKSELPKLERAELDCTQCHVAAGTRNVPGVLVRSIFTTPTGGQAPKTASYITGHESPLSERWGGWYVTGQHGKQVHMGNVVVQDKDRPEQVDRVAGANVASLAKQFDTSAYLIPDSDIVAHMVLAHQTQMHNLITLTNYQTRIALYNQGLSQSPTGGSRVVAKLPFKSELDDVRAQYEAPAEQLVRYLLFADEAQLSDPVVGTSTFVRDFSLLGPRDSKGRSLRDFDLQKRIFKYPCSYLIYSESFDALPEPAKTYVYHRLFEVLTGRDQSPTFARLSEEDRRAIFEILLATKPGLPTEWKVFTKQAK